LALVESHPHVLERDGWFECQPLFCQRAHEFNS
jgi:hypothetical protein